LLCCAPVLAANEKAVWRGRRLKVGQVRVFVPGQEADHVTPADHYQLVALAVDGNLVRQGALALGGFDPEERLAGREAVTSSPAFCRALWSHLVGLLDWESQAQQSKMASEDATHPTARPDVAALPSQLGQSGRMIEQECLRRFVALLAGPNWAASERTASWPSNGSQLVRRAEDYMRAYLRQPLSLLDLCRECAVSERTLHYAFQEVRGLSPMAYFKAVRLNKVRQQLKAAADKGTVYEIAHRWGFSHTGEFAGAYRRLFGELPSQTLNG
jgi:AraC-like DNA-binding protein